MFSIVLTFTNYISCW